jgi:hypothetical protein
VRPGNQIRAQAPASRAAGIKKICVPSKLGIAPAALPLYGLLLFAVLALPCARAQQKSTPNQRRQALYLMTHVPPSPAPVMPQTDTSQPVVLSSAWHKKISSQSAQLLALAQELNSALSHSNHDQIPVAAIQDAKRIEALAKSIKSAMEMGY